MHASVLLPLRDRLLPLPAWPLLRPLHALVPRLLRVLLLQSPAFPLLPPTHAPGFLLQRGLPLLRGLLLPLPVWPLLLPLLAPVARLRRVLWLRFPALPSPVLWNMLWLQPPLHPLAFSPPLAG